ncbi:phosphatidylinositol N-acetylglucosaminyltransferase subunit Y [Arapaima gigas]
MVFSLSTVTVLVPIISLFGLLYSASVDKNFPQGCTSTSSICFYSLLLPVTIPVYVFFHLWKWMGIKLFRHNYLRKRSVGEVQLMHDLGEHKYRQQRKEWLREKLKDIHTALIGSAEVAESARTGSPHPEVFRKEEDLFLQ